MSRVQASRRRGVLCASNNGLGRRWPGIGFAMAKLRVKFTFFQDLVKEPIIWEVGKRFDLVTNIRRADVTAEVSWAILELDGDQEHIDEAIKWASEKGVRVDPVEDSIVEG